MQRPEMLDTLRPATDTASLVSYVPLPGYGVLPVNAFVIDAKEPVLVDTGLAALGDAFMTRLGSVVDPADLEWIWLTHIDADHVGNLGRVLAAAPRATVVTSYLGMGKLGLLGIAPERVYFLNPGQTLDVGDRKLLALRPPTFDAPETTALFDTKTRTLLSSDCFGAILDSPAERAGAIDGERLRDGMTTWATIDAPWLHAIEKDALRRSLDAVRGLGATTVLSSHLPPAHELSTLLTVVEGARSASPFVGPDQAAMSAMMADAGAA